MYLTFVHMRPLINVKCDIENILDGNISYLLTYFHFFGFSEDICNQLIHF